MLDPREFIRTKRDGRRHPAADLRAFIAAYAGREIPDYQVSAWLMAAYLNGLDDAETEALTLALLHSGRVFDWQDLGRPSADKQVGEPFARPRANRASARRKARGRGALG